MEVLLFALFFISTLIFFIAGKNDFGRTESKLIIMEKENIKEEDMVIEEGKKEVKVEVAEKGNIKPQENIKGEDPVIEERKKEDKVEVAEKGNIKPQENIKNDS